MILRFLLVFFIIYWVGYLLRTYVFKPFQNGNGTQGDTSRGSAREGDVSINYNPAKDQKQQQSVGEYIDYEEVKENENDKN